LISIIEKIIIEKKVKKITRDDCFYFNLKDYIRMSDLSRMLLVMNSDMLVSTTDFPPYMNYFQFGLRAVISNISDLIVKGVKPKGIILSLGIPNYLNLDDFKNIIKGIVNSCNKYDLDYIGGDLNETKEIIISPTVFGFQENNKIIPREGIEVGDILVANGKFGLTGVGFDILLNQNNYESLKKRYKQSIQSVLEPDILGFEGLLIAEKKLASGSIDSSDGLAKSLLDLMQVNKNIGFEINFDKNLVSEEAIRYAQEFGKNINELVFNGGEEFIHLFTIHKDKFDDFKNYMKKTNGKINEIGRVISEPKIYVNKDNKKEEINLKGYEHFG